MIQLPLGRSPSRSPKNGRGEDTAGTGADTVMSSTGGLQFHDLLNLLRTWLRSDEGPPLTPEEEDERWRLLFGCGF